MVASADNTAAADSSIVVVADTVAADMAAWVATVVGIACSAEDVAIVVAALAVAHVGDIEAIPTLDLEGTSLAVAPILVARVVVALVDCP